MPPKSYVVGIAEILGEGLRVTNRVTVVVRVGMKVIIAGSRKVKSYPMVEHAIRRSGFEVTEVVSGKAIGADQMGERWARNHGVPVKEFPAYWEDLSFPDAIIKEDFKGRKYDARAGHRRNFWMAEYAEALIAIWNGKTRGTKNMIDHAKRRRLPTFIYRF